MTKVMNVAGVKVGDLFYDSWGWEQTNIDFYQVVGLRGKTQVVLKAIKSKKVPDGFMSCKVSPMVGAFKTGSYKTRQINGADDSIIRRVHKDPGGRVYAGSGEYMLFGCDEHKVLSETSYA